MAEGDGGVGPRRDVGREAARTARLSTLASGGLEFAGAILIGLFGGQWLDRRLGTGPWLVVAGVFVGAAAGFLSLYRTLIGGTKRPESRGPGGPGGG